MSKTEDEAEDLPKDEDVQGEEVEGEEIEGEEVVEEEEPEVFISADFISGPILSEESTIPDNILEFDFSYSYDCKRYYNLISPDPRTIIFASGNLINFFSVLDRKVVHFRRSAFGHGIGHITKNPNPEFPHIAVAENGIDPPVIVYEWPTMEIACLLRGGASRAFAHLDYSPKGDLLAAQAGEPDYLITIFDWPNKKILLRTKSYVNTVYNIKFSPEVPGQLTTCGMSHIKFWKMATTFTGLKLKGDLGRFGKTEYSDIVGVMPMPDEKVLSGCSWGNILVWDEGLIKVEVCRRKRKRCHDAPVMQLEYNTETGEIWTAALDGHIRVWLYDAIDQADPPEDDRVFEIEPTYDFETPGVEFVSYVKEDDNPENTMYFAQDGNGGLWRIDLNTNKPPQPSVQLYKCHAGAIADIEPCPWGTYFASFGFDGRLFVYQYLTRKVIFEYEFPSKGRCMIWLPLAFEPSGDQLFLAFDDGCVRSVILNISSGQDPTLSYFQIIKPHHLPITAMRLNRTGKLLITGSEDKTIFVFKVFNERGSYTKLEPIGLVPVPDIVSCFKWYKNPDTTVLVGCYRGYFVQMSLPNEPVPYTKISYALDVPVTINKFSSYKSQIRREIKIKEIEARKALKVERKRKEMQNLKAANPGLDIDEEVFLADSESDEVLEPLFYPEVPNRIIWMQLTPDETVWLSMAGYDAGYIYEYKIGQTDELPFRYKMVHDGDDIEICCYAFNHNRNFLIFAMQDGAIRVNKVNEGDFRDLSDYWRLPMHDNFNGYIPKMCFSYDEKYFFSCGHDGNVFAYKWSPPDKEYKKDLSIRMKCNQKLPEIDDTMSYEQLSLEQAMVKAEQDRIDKLANDHKNAILDQIAALKERFRILLSRNSRLLPTQIIHHEHLELDSRVTEDLQRKLDAEQKLAHRKLEFAVRKSELGMLKILAHFYDPLESFPITVHAINTNASVRVLRLMKLSPNFYPMQDEVDRRILDEEEKSRPPERPVTQQARRPMVRKRQTKMEYFLMGLSPDIVENKLGKKLQRMLERYRQRKMKWEVRQAQWDQFNFIKPIKGVDPPEDVAALADAEATIGDYKLKSDPLYKAPKHLRDTTVKKYKQFLNARERQFNIRNDFNMKLFNLRRRKETLCKFLQEKQEVLEHLHLELPINCIKEIPPLPKEYEDDNIEKNFEVVVDVPELLPEKVRSVRPEIHFLKHPDKNRLQKEVLQHGHIFEEVPENVVELLDNEAILNVCNTNFETLLHNTELEEGTPWEQEAKIRRVVRKVFQQDSVLDQMHRSVLEFDTEITDLMMERYNVRLRANTIDLHMLALHQELVVLKQFEAVEGKLSDEVNHILRQLIDMEENSGFTNEQRNKLKENVDALQAKEKEIQEQFYQIIANNKFYDFLKRIFKKKYKPPKEHHEGSDSESDSSSSSSSEDSDEDDEESIDSRDFGIIRLDESVCPKGCDPNMFALTYELRSQRYDIEIKVREKAKQIDILNKDLELAMKKLKRVEDQLKIKQDELDSYQREKQGKLNEILDVAVLKLDQIQPFVSEYEPGAIKDLLVFSKYKLTSLYNRVNELQRETLEQKAIHRVNKSHMGRMIGDMKLMSRQIHDVKRQIIERMKVRFGQIVDIDELEEQKIMDSMHLKFNHAVNVQEMEEELLKSIIKDIKLNMLDIRSIYIDEIKFWKDKFKVKQKELLDTIKANTTRMDVLSLLKREKDKLAGALKIQPVKQEFVVNVAEQIIGHKKDIYELSQVVRNQRKELDELKAEIKRLKTKGLCLKPEEKFEFPTKYGAEEESELDEWLDYDEYMELFGDYYAELFRRELEARKTLPRTSTLRASVLTTESEQIAKQIISDLLDAMGVMLDPDSSQAIIRSVLSDILRRCSVTVIIDSIIANLPVKPSDDQYGIIETSAEQLLSLQELEVTQADIQICTQELLEEIIDNTLLAVGEPHDVVMRMVEALVEQIPFDYVNTDKSIDYITKKVSDIKVDKEKLRGSIESVTRALKDEMAIIINQIIDNLP